MTTRGRRIEHRAAESRRGRKPAHSLQVARPGKNRHQLGYYRCSCGQHFTGINQWETHRALATKSDK